MPDFPLLPYKPQMSEQEPDFVLVTGDAYVDHPSFGAAVIGRVLESRGYSVAILSQPNWHKPNAFKVFGRPRLGFLVTSGNIDSMVAHYTANKRIRHDDAFTPGNVHGKRPDRAVTVYCRHIRSAYPDAVIIAGGLEASLRRFAHYDYWDNKVRPGLLFDAPADLIVHGMGERTVIKIADALAEGKPLSGLRYLPGTACLCSETDLSGDYGELPSYEDVASSSAAGKKAFAEMTKAIMNQGAKTLVQKYNGCSHNNKYLVLNPNAEPLNTEELDALYELPFAYDYPEEYRERGGVKGFEEVKFSLTHNRGCFGGCSFCSIQLHQGRTVTSRSTQSVLKEAERLTRLPDFKGYIHDVGGATANFRSAACTKQNKKGACTDKYCLWPKPCINLKPDHSEYFGLLRDIRKLPGVKKVFIRSGIRYDYLMADKNHKRYIDELVKHHVSGQLRVAPEHTEGEVLNAMGKPGFGEYLKFQKLFYDATAKAQKEQYLLPYLISAHPGCTVTHSIRLAKRLKEMHIHPDQVQDFYPTPSSVSTCMYYTNIDPRNGKRVYVPRKPSERRLQRALMQYWLPQNREIIKKAGIKI